MSGTFQIIKNERKWVKSINKITEAPLAIRVRYWSNTSNKL